VERTYTGFAALLIALCLGVTSTPARAFVSPNTSVGHRGASDMVYVPGTTFKLGIQASWGGATPGQASSGDNPAGVDVHVSSFFIDRLEVSAAQYHACVLAGGCPALTLGDTTDAKYTQLCTYGKAGYESHPINCVVHAEAAKYCGWAGKRLPTESEFELAERGPSGKAFPWGDDPPTPKRVNACDASLAREAQSKLGTSFTSMWTDGGDDGWAFTAPVGTYPEGASPYGALDMSGNVEEWVSDPWWEMTGGATGPKPLSAGAPAGDDHVVRGGSWDLNSFDSFAATRRVAYQSSTRAAWLGFRCAKDG
jgi:formylglycine-generating enzyme required for sulfatase activity